MARTTTDAQLLKLRKQMQELQAKEKQLLSKANNKVLTQIVALAKKNGISAEEITEALGRTKTTSKVKAQRAAKKAPTERAKVPAKYFNPENPAQKWSGRGLLPSWAKALKESGLLETALIVAE